MIEKRCPKCNHLFFKVENHQQWCKSLKIHVKCSKCKEIFEIVHHDGDDYDYPKIMIDGIPLDELMKSIDKNQEHPVITKESLLKAIEQLKAIK